MDFRIGDRVMYIRSRPIGEVKFGGLGTVVALRENLQRIPIGVRWDDFVGGHTCGGACEVGHGYWMFEEQVALLNENTPFEPSTDADFLNILLNS